MSVVIRATIKNKGQILWPPIGEPLRAENVEEGSPEDRRRYAEWLREEIRSVADHTRTALGSSTMVAVHVQVSFRPDVMVDPL